MNKVEAYTKPCVDCKHFRRDIGFVALSVVLACTIIGIPTAIYIWRQSARFAKCKASGYWNSEQRTIALVTGGTFTPKKDLYYCTTERSSRATDSCGPAGAFFVGKYDDRSQLG